MPWENIGDVDTGELPNDGDWIEFCQKLAVQYLLFVCGEPPAGTSLEIRLQDHELGSYPSIALWYEFDEPWEYLHKCEKALDVLNDSIAWDDLKVHYENSIAEDVDDEIHYAENDEDTECEESTVESLTASLVATDSVSSQEPPNDDFPVDDFAHVGAMMLIEGVAADEDYSPEDFYAQMKAEWGEVIDSDWDKIHTQSLKRRNEWLNEQRKLITNDDFYYEYGWDVSDDELAEILGQESEYVRDDEEIDRELAEAERALAETEEELHEAGQKVREIQHTIALEFERLVNGEGLAENASFSDSTEGSTVVVHRSDIDALGFFSQAYRAVESKMPNRASAEQVRAILGPESGIKKEELEWLDIESFLLDNSHPSKQQMLDYIRVHNVTLEEIQLGNDANPHTRFQSSPYHLPAGENYREFVLTMPGQIESYEPDQMHFTSEGNGTAVVWARFDDRDGGETLHIAEIQSKRHQDGRNRGYRNKDGNRSLSVNEVPDAPFRNANAWSMLMFRRMLRHAVENGYKRITWDTGKTQTTRYGLEEAGRRGMEAFYDQLLVNNVNRFVRKWDARVVGATSQNGWTVDAGLNGQVPVHSLEINDEMRGVVMDDGIHLFSRLLPGE